MVLQEITVELKRDMEQEAEPDSVSAAVADLVDSLMQLAHATRSPFGLPVRVTACPSVPFSLDLYTHGVIQCPIPVL